MKPKMQLQDQQHPLWLLACFELATSDVFIGSKSHLFILEPELDEEKMN